MPATLADIQKKYGESVYPLYKDQMHEPYMENDTGNGYKGLVLHDELNDKVMCYECGKWLRFLSSSHLKTHLLDASLYKERYGLYQKTPLCSKSYSTSARKNAFKKKLGIVKNNYTTMRKKIKEKYNSHTLYSSLAKKRNNVMQTKNKFGLCDAQIAARLVIARDMLGKEKIEDITMGELSKIDNRLIQSMTYRYGGYKLAREALGLSGRSGRSGRKSYKDSELIAGLRNWVIKNKKIPSYNSKKKIGLCDIGLADQKTYVYHFGSWRRAKMMAGLDQLLEEVKAK